MPAIPAQTPNSLRGASASWRVMASVRKKVKIGDVELRMVASPASSERTLQASMVQGITLLRQACHRKRRQVAASIGSVMPAPAHDDEEQQARDQGARGDQGDRRNCRHADLDEAVGRAPQRRERQQQRQLDGDVGWARRGCCMAVGPFSMLSRRTLQAGELEYFVTCRSVCRVPDAVQRATLLRRAGTHPQSKQDGPRISSASLRAALRPGNVSSHIEARLNALHGVRGTPISRPSRPRTRRRHSRLPAESAVAGRR